METSNLPVNDTDDNTARELANMQAEPLLGVEKWLIGLSLALGVVLLGVLLWVSKTYYPIGG